MAKDNKAGASAPASTPTAPATLEEAVTLLAEANDKLAEAEKALEKEKAESAKQIDELKAELKDAADVIEELKANADLNKGGKSKGPVVVIGKKKYLVKAGTVINSKPYSPADLAANKELCAELIGKGSKLLIEIK